MRWRDIRLVLCPGLVSAACLLTSLSCARSMAPTGSVLVHVSELGQGSVPGKLIELVGTPLSGSTDGNGEVLFDVRPGRYVVRAHINAPGPADHVDQGVEVKSAHTVRVEFANCAPCGSPTS